ncbi:MAG: ABC transporter permease subunit, partial [Clostridiales bacterium]
MDWFPVFLSIKVALIASIIAFLIGTPLARLFHKKDFFAKDFLEALLLLPLVLPPSVLGYGLLMFLGTNSFLGAFLADMGIQVIFTVTAAIIAASIVALPLFYQSAKAAFAGVDENLESAALTLGASPKRVFMTISLPLAWPGLMAGWV